MTIKCPFCGKTHENADAYAKCAYEHEDACKKEENEREALIAEYQELCVKEEKARKDIMDFRREHPELFGTPFEPHWMWDILFGR